MNPSCWAGAVVLALLALGVAWGDEAKLQGQRMLSEEDESKADALEDRMWDLFVAGKFKEALEPAREHQAFRGKKQGADHWQTVNTDWQVKTLQKGLTMSEEDRGALAEALGAANRAKALEGMNRAREAQRLREQVLEALRKLLGEDHPFTADAYYTLAGNLDHQARYAQAEPHHRKVVAIRRKVLGDNHLATTTALNDLGINLYRQGKLKEAEAEYRKALAMRLKVLGEEHRYTAANYDNLAVALGDMGRYEESEGLLRKSLGIHRRVLGEEHQDTGICYNNLGTIFYSRGKYREAEECHRRALVIMRKQLGEEHPSTAIAYSSLSNDLFKQRKVAEAEEGYRTSLAIFLKVLGEKHPFTATARSSVSVALELQGKYADAEAGHRAALAARIASLGEEHHDVAESYANLAGALVSQNKNTAAEEACRKALAVYRKAGLGRHPRVGLVESNLGFTLARQGKFKEAEEAFASAESLQRDLLGDSHPELGMSRVKLGRALHSQGKYREAEKVWALAADQFHRGRTEITAQGVDRVAWSEPAQALLPLAGVLARNGKPEQAWDRLEQCLGRSTWDELSARLLRTPEEQDRLRNLQTQLERLDQGILRLAVLPKPTEEQQKEREGLLTQRRRAQDNLDDFLKQLQQKHGVREGKEFTLEQIQARLPEDAALVGWVDLRQDREAKRSGEEHWGVVVRAKGKPIWVALKGSGADDAWTEDDDLLTSRLALALRNPKEGDWRELARKVTRQRFDVLVPHLRATKELPAVRRLVILPASQMDLIPLEVLTDRYTVSRVSSGTLLAHLRGLPRPQTTGLLAVADPVLERDAAAPLPPHGLLLTVILPDSNSARSGLKPGDVLLRYNDVKIEKQADLKLVRPGEPGTKVGVEVWREGKTHKLTVAPGPLGIVVASEPAPTALAQQRRRDEKLSGLRGELAPLPGTRVEVEALRKLFEASKQPVRLLTDSEASEQGLAVLAERRELGKVRYLHLASHGEMDARYPLQSRVFLSRDALPDPARQLTEGKPIFDGQLTAAELLRDWKLDCELVTLSACQTALGTQELGEGYVGFAQAALLAGTRSVCLSLWKVDDAATALLMARFYQNLLGQRDGLREPLPRAEALAEAKRWLRNLPRDEALKWAARLSGGVERGKGRPARPLLSALPESSDKDAPPFAHPFYWAAFVLVGDPG